MAETEGPLNKVRGSGSRTARIIKDPAANRTNRGRYMTNWDVLIVGAGQAGCAAAWIWLRPGCEWP